MSPWLAVVPALAGLIVFLLTRRWSKPASLGAAFVAVTLAAAAGYMQERAGGPDARDAAMQVNLDLVRMGLEQYATDHQGAYPPASSWVTELS